MPAQWIDDPAADVHGSVLPEQWIGRDLYLPDAMWSVEEDDPRCWSDVLLGAIACAASCIAILGVVLGVVWLHNALGLLGGS